MDEKFLAKQISDISYNEENLLHYSPAEILAALKNNQCVVLFDKDFLAGFAFYHFFGGWVEISTIYVFPEFRGKGYLSQLIRNLKGKLVGQVDCAFLFTRNPIVGHVAEKFFF